MDIKRNSKAKEKMITQLKKGIGHKYAQETNLQGKLFRTIILIVYHLHNETITKIVINAQ